MAHSSISNALLFTNNSKAMQTIASIGRRRRFARATLLLLCVNASTASAFAPKGSTSSSASVRSNPNNHTRNPLARFTKNNNDDDEDVPPSQVESISLNAKLLQPFGAIDVDALKDTVPQSLAAGLAVSLAMVPEAVSFAFVAGVNPLVGLWTTVVLGFFAAAFGGRAGICSSASGACSVVVAALCASHGQAHLSACALLAGALQILAGMLKLGRFVRLIPHPVIRAIRPVQLWS